MSTSEEPAIMTNEQWFHPNLSGHKAEALLMERGIRGSFLVRPSQSNPDNFALSVKQDDSVTHIRIKKSGIHYYVDEDCLFSSLAELIKFYVENSHLLKEKEGEWIKLILPLCHEAILTDLWYHGSIYGREAEMLLISKGRHGSYLIRNSANSQGNYVISARIQDQVTEIKILFENNKYSIGGGPQFSSIHDLVQHYKQKPLTGANGQVITLDIPLHSTSFLPLYIKQRIEQLEKAHQTFLGKTSLWEEFNYLQQQELHHLYSQKEGSKPENVAKNRFKNLIPFDHTLVTIENSYINASYINGEVNGSEHSYIATQGCLPTTVDDFWAVVWQEKCLVIVLLTNEVERGHNMCYCYWPNPVEPAIYEKISVMVLEETVNPHYILRHFLVNHEEDDEERHVFHFQFKAWPDDGNIIPSNASVTLGLMEDVNLKMKELNDAGLKPGPIIVQCSNGVGRTGTYIAIDILIKLIEHQGWESKIDIQRSVQLLRAHRGGMIQYEDQYKFVYQTLLHYIETTKLRLQAASDNTRSPHSAEFHYSNVPLSSSPLLRTEVLGKASPKQ